MKKTLFYIFLISFFTVQTSFAEIREIKSMQEIKESVKPDTLLVFDIDSTLLMPTTYLGSDPWWDHLIDKYIKAGSSKQEALEKAAKDWRDSQKDIQINPVEDITPALVSEFQKNNIKVFALTARGFPIADLTINQLANNQIDFQKSALTKQIEIKLQDKYPALYKKGVLFVGDNNKGILLLKFLEKLKYKAKNIVFVDDKLKNVQNVNEALEKANIPIIAYRYGAADDRVKSFNGVAADIQHELTQKAISNEEAIVLQKYRAKQLDSCLQK